MDAGKSLIVSLVQNNLPAFLALPTSTPKGASQLSRDVCLSCKTLPAVCVSVRFIATRMHVKSMARVCLSCIHHDCFYFLEWEKPLTLESTAHGWEVALHHSIKGIANRQLGSIRRHCTRRN